MGTVGAKKLKHMHPDIQHSMSEHVQVPILALLFQSWNILTGPAGKPSMDITMLAGGGGHPVGGNNPT